MKIGKKGIIATLAGVALAGFGIYKLVEKPEYIESTYTNDEDDCDYEDDRIEESSEEE